MDNYKPNRWEVFWFKWFIISHDSW